MKDVPCYYHRLAKLNLLIIGAMTTSNGSKCFVCVETKDSKERLFPIEGFDSSMHELESLWTALNVKEQRRIKSKRVKEKGLARKQRDQMRQKQDDYEAQRDEDLEKATRFSYEPVQPSEESSDNEPVETQSEIIGRGDSEGHDSYESELELALAAEATFEVEDEEN